MGEIHQSTDFGIQITRFDVDEHRSTLLRKCLGKHSLSTTGRTVEEDTFRGAKQAGRRFESGGIAEWEDDRFLQVGYNRIQTSNVLMVKQNQGPISESLSKRQM